MSGDLSLWVSLLYFLCPFYKHLNSGYGHLRYQRNLYRQSQMLVSRAVLLDNTAVSLYFMPICASREGDCRRHTGGQHLWRSFSVFEEKNLKLNAVLLSFSGQRYEWTHMTPEMSHFHVYLKFLPWPLQSVQCLENNFHWIPFRLKSRSQSMQYHSR